MLQQLSLFEAPRLPRPGMLVDEFSLEYPFYMGIYSRYFPHLRRKEILRGAAVFIAGLPPDWGYSPAGIARAIIEDRRQPRRGPGDRRWEQISPPWFAPAGGFLPEGIFLDLYRAYESILRWGIRDCSPGRFFSRWPIWEIPPRFWEGPGEKAVLRILPSCGMEGKIRYFRSPEDIRIIPRPATERRPWGTVMVILHALCGVARRLGAIYWNVDGGIFPPEGGQEFLEILRSLGLPAREKARGPALVLGRGTYAVGGRISLPYRQGYFGWKSSDEEDEFREWAMRMILG